MEKYKGRWTKIGRWASRVVMYLALAQAACSSQPEQAQARASTQAAGSEDTAVPERQSEPSWSPDGSRIAFRGGAFPEVDIWLADADGTDPVRLVDHRAADDYPVWSPDGTRLAFVSNRDGVWKMYVIDPDGSGHRELAVTSELERDPARPAWSPDGEELIVRVRDPDESTRLVAVPLAGGEPRPIPAREGADWPDVAPDGSLVFSAEDGDGVRQIWSMRRDGDRLRPITRGPGRKSLPRVTPDGGHVLYIVNDSGTPLGWEFARSRLDGSETERLTNDEFWKFYPEPSPDGERILFTTIREGMNGPARLWLMDADGSNARPLFGEDG